MLDTTPHAHPITPTHSGWTATLGFATPANGGGESFAVPGAPATQGGEAAPDGSQQVPPPNGQQGTGAGGGNSTFLFVMVGLMAFMIIMTITSGRKQKKQRQNMMSSLKKHDKVVTSGGVIGTITEMNDSEVVLKVDEGSNTRIRFAKSAITSVLHSARGEASPEVSP